MNWLDLGSYVPGMCALVVLGMGATAAEKTYRWFRPQPVTCDVCGGPDGIDVVIDTPAQTLAFHDACLDDDHVTNLATGWTGTWPDLDRHIATLTRQETSQ